MTILLPTIIYANHELSLIQKINNFFNFDHNVYLLDQSADMNRFITHDSTPRSIHVFDGSDNNYMTGSKIAIKIASKKHTFMIVARQNSIFRENLNLFIRVKDIQRQHVNMKIGIFFTHTATKEDLQKLFEWSWKHRIINIFAAYHPQGSEYPLNIFTFNPFGTFDVLNVTGSVDYDSLFLDQKSNFQRYHVPQVAYFAGYATKEFWSCVSDVMNASFVSVEHNFTNFNDTWLQELYNNGIDMIAGIIRQDSLEKIHLYPFMMEPLHIVVPKALPYSDFSAYLKTITSDKIFGYFLGTICVVVVLLLISRYIKQKKILIIQSIADVLNLLMNDNGAVKYLRLSSIEIMLIVPLTFVGLVFVNGILSTLQSFVTRPILQPQINTIEKLYESQLPIFVSGDEWKRSLIDVIDNKTNTPNAKNLNDRMHVMHNMLIVRQAFTYNRSISLLLEKSMLNMLLSVQTKLKIDGYHIIPTAIFTFYGAFFVHGEFPFILRLNEISLWMQSAGLFAQWVKTASIENEYKYLKFTRKLLQNRDDSDVESFPFPMVIVYGWIASMILFGIEIIWQKLKIWLNKIFCCALAYFKMSLVKLLIFVVKIQNRQ